MESQKIEYELSADEYMEVQTYFMLRQGNIVKYCIALLSIGLILGIIKLTTGSGVNGVWVLVIFPFPYLAYVIFKIRNMAYRMYKNDISKWKVILTDTGINAIAVKQNRNLEAEWFSIVKTWRTKKYVFFFLSKSVYIVIPLRAIKDGVLFEKYIELAKK